MFELTKSHLQIKKAVNDFNKGVLKKEIIGDLVESSSFPNKIWKKAADLGFIGIHFPECYSGQGLGIFENVLIAEELCRGDSTVGFCLTRAGHGSELLLRFGNEDQKGNWLPKVTEATVLSSGAFTEPGLGNNISGAKATAKKNGDHWVVNGIKSFVINAGAQTGIYIVLCRTGGSSEEQLENFSLFLIESNLKGIMVSDVGKRLGCRLASFGEVRFENVRIPLNNLIGVEDQGLEHVKAYLDESRILSAAQALGMAQGAFERSLLYVKKREQFGHKLIDFQVTRNKLAEMHTKIEASRFLTYHAASIFDTKKAKDIRKFSAMAKLFTCRAAVEVCDEAIQLHGGYGYIQEYEVERYYRDAKMVELLDGVCGTQKETIAAEIS
jgi:alkylation response protein AidB-like acyl-CoA dehydrogenase